MEENLPFVQTLFNDTLKCIVICDFHKTTLIIITEQFIFIFLYLAFFNCSYDGIDILSIHDIENILVSIYGKNRF